MPDPIRDPETGLLNEHYFDAALPNRVATARRVLHPISVAVIAVGDGADPTVVAPALLDALRESDTACRLLDGSYAILLEDTPEDGARRTVERIRDLLGDAPMWAGIACYPAHALSSDDLRAMADAALVVARASTGPRIEVATS